MKHKNPFHRFRLVWSLVTLGILSIPAQGGIISVSNQVAIIPPPPSVISTNQFTNNLLYIFPERTALTVSNPVIANIRQPGTYNSPSQVITNTGNVFLTVPVDSYYVHHAGGGPTNSASATIVFDSDILAIICISSNLAATHLQFGAPGTAYALAPGLQGFEFGTAITADRVIFLADRRTVTITTAAAVGTLDDLRIITAANSVLPPVANAGPDQSVVEFDIVTLDGSASFDPNTPALPLTYSWTQVSGIEVALAGADTPNPIFFVPDAPDEGAVLVFQLTVSNGTFSHSDTVNVNINFVNSPPTAHAGTNIVAAENTLVTLDGSASNDPDDDTLTFQWTQISGPTVTLNGANTMHPTFTAPSVTVAQAGIQFQFQLVVNDGQVSSGPAVVTVTAINVNDPPSANPGVNQNVSELAFVTLNGSASSDPDGNPLTYSWTQILGIPVTLNINSSNAAIATFTAPQLNVGGSNFNVTLTFQLTVSDGLATNSRTMNVRVNNINHPPIVDAGPNQTVPAGALVTLDGSGTADIDGDPITYGWFQIGAPGVPNVTISNSTSAIASFVAPVVGPAGVTLRFTLQAFDAFGAFGTNAVNIHVTYVNHPPIVNAGTPQTVNEGDVATLSGTASDPDGNALAISWTQVSGPTVTLVNPGTLTPSFIAPSVTRDEADVVLRLTADDSFGGIATNDVTIHIANINHAPVAQPPANMTVPEDTEATLVGQATDADTEEQNALLYAWTQTGGPEVILLSSGANASFIAPIVTSGGDPGASITLTFALTVTDPNGASGTNSVDVLVANVVHTPTAVAGNNLTVNEGAPVTLNGSASSDPDGDPLTFSWVQVSGPAVTLLDANTAFPQFTAPFVSAAGAALQFQLTVDDGFGGTNSATVTVTVNNVNNPPNITQAQASPATLWPPNHNMVEVAIVGIIDPNNDATITVTSVTQDEAPVDIDAVINADGTVLLRAERDANGNGRVYHIHFTASDSEGSASGVVKVSVPKSKKTDAAVDDGELYNSTQ